MTDVLATRARPPERTFWNLVPNARPMSAARPVTATASAPAGATTRCCPRSAFRPAAVHLRGGGDAVARPEGRSA